MTQHLPQKHIPAHIYATQLLVSALCLTGCADSATPATGTAPTYPGTSTLEATPAPPAFSPATNDARSVQVSISSETFGQRGFTYSATPREGEPVFVDGWELRFSRILVTVHNIRIHRPGTSPSDQAAVGAVVARNPRAYAVNIQRSGALTGAGGGEETAIPLFVFRTDDNGRALDPTVRYAFSYDTVPATMASTNVNLDAGDITAYQSMIARGWTQLIEGTATYRGAPAPAGSHFADYPSTVRLTLGFGAPAQYLNCFNPDNGGDDMPGVQPRSTGAARAQLSFHMDHAFWEALGREDPPLHFDHLAARATMGAVTLDALMGVVPTNLRDLRDRAVPDRGGQTMGYTPRNPMALSLDLGGTAGISDVRDFVTHSMRASAHFNADGLCAVRPTAAIRY